MGSESEHPSPYFGDYPDGAYFAAVAPEGAEVPRDDEESTYTYDGSFLRVMWDEDAGPLWGEGGLLGEDAEWMSRALGLSDTLIDDLLAWHRDMTALHLGPSVEDWREQGRRLDDRGHALAERLQREVGPRFRVWYHA